MHSVGALIALGLVAAGAAAAQTGALPVDDLRPLLVEALRASGGRASGVMSGRLADGFGARFATAAPLLVEVSTLRRYRQPGCARLHVKFSQTGVVDKEGAAPADRVMAVQLDYCADGTPPARLE